MKAQDAIIMNFAEATTGRLGAPTDKASMHAELAAAERQRTQLELEKVIANTLVDAAAGQNPAKWKPILRHRSLHIAQRIPTKAALCERTVVAAHNDLHAG
jgi:hypothetical protein